MFLITLFLSFFSLGIGLAVLVANPKRGVNRAFGSLSCVLALCLFCISRIAYNDDLNNFVGVKLWIRSAAIASAFIPVAMWLLKDTLAPIPANAYGGIRRSLPISATAIGLVALACSKTFFSDGLVRGAFQRGVNYYIYNVVICVFTSLIVFSALRQIKKETGVRRIRLNVFVVNIGFVFIFCMALNTIGSATGNYFIKQLGLAFIFYGYCSVAWGITVGRILDGREALLNLGRWLFVISIVSVAILVLSWTGRKMLIPASSLIPLEGVLASVAALLLDRSSRRWLDLDGRREVARIRQAVVAIARVEPEPRKLIVLFESLLRENCRTKFAGFISKGGEGCAQFSIEGEGHSLLSEMGWITPEYLERRRYRAREMKLKEILTTNSASLVIAVPRGAPSPSSIIVFGGKVNDGIFSDPEIQRLQNIAELMDNILTHARVTADAALKAKAEHLAMMSKGLAHDLKNLITPVSSFLVHTEGRFTAGTDEAEVHGAAKRSVRIMTDYVREALFFSERLAPRFEPVDIESVSSAVRDATLMQAERRGIVLQIEGEERITIEADRVLLQRMFANLVANATDASKPGDAVVMSRSVLRAGWVRVQVSDRGCGIPPENLRRVFEPYFTTKEFGDEVRGFGLGLAICERIVQLHRGSISVESEVGRGTTMSVDLPVTQGA